MSVIICHIILLQKAYWMKRGRMIMYKKIYIIALIGAAIVLSINQKGKRDYRKEKNVL